MLEGELRRIGRPSWWRIAQVSNYVPKFWKRLQNESTRTFVVVPYEQLCPLLRPYVELGRDVVSVGPSSEWSEPQTETIKMLAEEGPSRCVWLAVTPGTAFVSAITAAYDHVTRLQDVFTEIPHEFDHSALEAALRASSEAFVFCPGAEEPVILVAGKVVPT